MDKILQITPAPVGMLAHYGEAADSEKHFCPVACLALVETADKLTGKTITEVRAMVIQGADCGDVLCFADEADNFAGIGHL